jgi:hypothetical protein
MPDRSGSSLASRSAILARNATPCPVEKEENVKVVTGLLQEVRGAGHVPATWQRATPGHSHRTTRFTRRWVDRLLWAGQSAVVAFSGLRAEGFAVYGRRRRDHRGGTLQPRLAGLPPRRGRQADPGGSPGRGVTLEPRQSRASLAAPASSDLVAGAPVQARQPSGRLPSHEPVGRGVVAYAEGRSARRSTRLNAYRYGRSSSSRSSSRSR